MRFMQVVLIAGCLGPWIPTRAGEADPSPVTIEIIQERTAEYRTPGPIYLDVVMSNKGTADVKMAAYPLLVSQLPCFNEYGSGLKVELQSADNKVLSFGGDFHEWREGVFPPRATLKAGCSWRFTVNLCDIFQAQAHGSDKLPEGEYSMRMLVESLGIASAPAKIKLTASKDGDVTVTTKSENRNGLGTPRECLTATMADESVKVGDGVPPSLRHAVKAFCEIGKALKGKPDVISVVAGLPKEEEWGVWSDDMALLGYELFVKKQGGNTDEVKRVRAEVEKAYPGAKWELENIDKGNGMLARYKAFAESWKIMDERNAPTKAEPPRTTAGEESKLKGDK